MPLHTNAGPGIKNVVYVAPKAGKFIVEKDGHQETFQSIEGVLDLIRIEFDAGNPTFKIEPYDAFIMRISDNENSYQIKINLDRNFTSSVVRALGDLKKGDEIIAKAKAGDDPTVTFCNILKKDAEGNWVRPILSELPKEKAKKLKAMREIVEGHSAFQTKWVPKAEFDAAQEMTASKNSK